MDKNKSGKKYPKPDENIEVINVDGFKLHLSEIGAALNNHENDDKQDLINPDDIYNKKFEDL